MGVEKNFNDSNANKTNLPNIYRPPPLRNLHCEESNNSTKGSSKRENLPNATATMRENHAATKTITATNKPEAYVSETTSMSSLSSCNNHLLHANESPTPTTTATTTTTKHSAETSSNECVNSMTSNVATAKITNTDEATATTTNTSVANASATTTTTSAGSQRQTTARRERRPDRAVYIPRARRSQTTPPVQPETITTANTYGSVTTPPSSSTSYTAAVTTTLLTTCNPQQLAITADTGNSVSVLSVSSDKADAADTIPNDKNQIANNSAATATAKPAKKAKTTKDRKERTKKSSIKSSSSSSTSNPLHLSSLAPATNSSQAVEPSAGTTTSSGKLVPLEYKEVQTIVTISPSEDFSKLSSTQFCDIEHQEAYRPLRETSSKPLVSQVIAISKAEAKLQTPKEKPQEESLELNHNENYNYNNHHHPNHQNHQLPDNFTPSTMNKKGSNKNGGSLSNSNSNSNRAKPLEMSKWRIEDIAAQESDSRKSEKCDNDEQELKRASKEINRSNRRIIKQTFVSDVLEIPDKIETLSPKGQKTSSLPASKAVSTANANTNSKNNSNKRFDSTTEEEDEEDDWETMYDETGECLDPKVMQELTAAVGKVKLQLPQMDYSDFQTKLSLLNDDEFPHVLEVSNFPVEFKNQDLMMVFSQYKESGFDIKWVDDTHALAVFSSSRIAAEALTMGHPFVQLKPLSEATDESRMKARRCASSLQPYKPRPETCAALARRLVTGALGVRLKTAAAERENEKRVLREAKERKLLLAKQRDEAWEN